MTEGKSFVGSFVSLYNEHTHLLNNAKLRPHPLKGGGRFVFNTELNNLGYIMGNQPALNIGGERRCNRGHPIITV